MFLFCSTPSCNYKMFDLKQSLIYAGLLFKIEKTFHTPIPSITHLLFKKLIFQRFCGFCSATACSYFAVCLHYYFFSKPTSWHLAVDTTDGFKLKFLHCQFCGMRKEDRRRVLILQLQMFKLSCDKTMPVSITFELDLFFGRGDFLHLGVLRIDERMKN